MVKSRGHGAASGTKSSVASSSQLFDRVLPLLRADCPSTMTECPKGCCAHTGWVCCSDPDYCAADASQCPTKIIVWGRTTNVFEIKRKLSNAPLQKRTNKSFISRYIAIKLWKTNTFFFSWRYSTSIAGGINPFLYFSFWIDRLINKYIGMIENMWVTLWDNAPVHLREHTLA